jgi:hypothetical protein
MRAFTIITSIMAAVLIAGAFALAGSRRPLPPGRGEGEQHEAVERMLERMSGGEHRGMHMRREHGHEGGEEGEHEEQ